MAITTAAARWTIRRWPRSSWRAGIPTYGTSGIFVEYGEIRIHGRDERVLIKSFFDGREFLYRLVKTLSE
ncbi:MAG: hypothetical protein ACXW13_09140 [Burkholderiaceae bacterium]